MGTISMAEQYFSDFFTDYILCHTYAKCIEIWEGFHGTYSYNYY